MTLFTESWEGLGDEHNLISDADIFIVYERHITMVALTFLQYKSSRIVEPS